MASEREACEVAGAERVGGAGARVTVGVGCEGDERGD